MGGGPNTPNETLLILLPFPENPTITTRLSKRFPSLKIIWHALTSFYQSPSTIPPDLFSNCTILCTLFTLPADPANDSPHLKWIHFFSAGVNNAADHPVWKTDIILTSSSGVHGPQITEWFVMTLLTSSHNYNLLLDQQREHKWDTSHVDTVNDLVGQRLGVLGYGSIGRQAARVATALGMETYAYTATPKDTADSRRDKGFIVPGTGDAEGTFPAKWFSGLDKQSLHAFLSQDLDVLLVSVPLTKSTTHFLSTAEFKILGKKKTFVSNISRGAIIDQPTLIAALKEGKLRGAALDVTDPEPLPKESELWDLDNVLVTPHISGRGKAYMERSFLILEGNIERFEGGERMWNVVDRERGY